MFVILYKVVLCCECVDKLKLVPEEGREGGMHKKTNHNSRPLQVY